MFAGAGIAGLTFALTCRQIGVPVKVFEQVDEIRPLGVGINLQPHAIRELMELGLQSWFDAIGIRTREVAYFFQAWSTDLVPKRAESEAGYNWPAIVVGFTRGKLQLMLLQTPSATSSGRTPSRPDGKPPALLPGKSGVTLHLENRKGDDRVRARQHAPLAADGHFIPRSAPRKNSTPGPGTSCLGRRRTVARDPAWARHGHSLTGRLPWPWLRGP